MSTKAAGIAAVVLTSLLAIFQGMKHANDWLRYQGR